MEQYIGIPYVPYGRDTKGCDCYGLVRYVLMQEKGVVLPEYDSSYVLGKDISILKTEPLLVGDKQEKPCDFDIVLLYKKDVPIHMGIYLQNGVLHASEKYGSIYEKMVSPFLKRFTKKEYYRVNTITT